jgi:type II secretory pathway pseudopilin PulG
VEVVLSALILAILAVGGGAFLYHSRARIGIERNRRVALEIANSRLESLRASGFNVIKPSANDYTVRYLVWNGGAWVQSTTVPSPSETVVINNFNLPMQTAVQFVNDGSAAYDYVRATVEVRYRVARSDTVGLTTLIGPPRL